MRVNNDSDDDSSLYQDFLIVDSNDNDDKEMIEVLSQESEDEGYLLHERNIQLCSSGSVITWVDRVDDNEEHLIVDIIEVSLVKDDNAVKESYIRYVCSTGLLNSYTNIEYFLKAFSTLF